MENKNKKIKIKIGHVNAGLGTFYGVISKTLFRSASPLMSSLQNKFEIVVKFSSSSSFPVKTKLFKPRSKNLNYAYKKYISTKYSI